MINYYDHDVRVEGVKPISITFFSNPARFLSFHRPRNKWKNSGHPRCEVNPCLEATIGAIQLRFDSASEHVTYEILLSPQNVNGVIQFPGLEAARLGLTVAVSVL